MFNRILLLILLKLEPFKTAFRLNATISTVFVIHFIVFHCLSPCFASYLLI